MINWETTDIDFNNNDIEYRTVTPDDIILYNLVVNNGSLPNFPQIGCSLYDTFKCLTVDGGMVTFLFKTSLETAGFDIDDTDIKVYDTAVHLNLGDRLTININPIETLIEMNTVPKPIDDEASLPILNNIYDERRFK